MQPFIFFGKRIALLLCNCWTTEGRMRAALAKRAKLRALRQERLQMERDGLYVPSAALSTKFSTSIRNLLSPQTPASTKYFATPFTNFSASVKTLFSPSSKNVNTSSFMRSFSNNNFGSTKSLNVDDNNIQSPPLLSAKMSESERLAVTPSGKYREEEERQFRGNIDNIKSQDEYLFEHGDLFDDNDEDEPLPTITPFWNIVQRNLIYAALCCGGWSKFVEFCTHIKDSIFRAVLKNSIVSYVRMKFHFVLEYFRGHSSETLVGLGNDRKLQGHWRLSLQFGAREKNVTVLTHRLEFELNKAKKEFIAEHQLIISVFDYTVDVSGIFMLVSPYKWNRMWFTILIWVEMTMYVVFSAPANYLLRWDAKMAAAIAFNLFMIGFTYLVQPYAHNIDRWLDFLGRIVIIVVCCGLLLCAYFLPSANTGSAPFAMYRPWVSYDYILHTNFIGAVPYILTDALMVVVIYLYIIGTLHSMKVFAAIQHRIQFMLYTFHDHILDFLVQKLDERTIGPENIFTGLLLVQQWDDIIRHQRRYALLPHADVRPYSLLPLSAKYLEVKWASLFNLNITNIRSSLGLTLLHTAMCSADGEVCRWIIYYYPELLIVEDSQRDTPIGIALKECAYNLLRYSKMNGGRLDDGTSYEDNQYFDYYSEITSIRDDISRNGEFVKDRATIYILNAVESIELVTKGYFNETIEEVKKVVKQPLTDKQKRMAMIRGLRGVGTKKSDDSASVYSTSTAAGRKALAESLKPKFNFGYQMKKATAKSKQSGTGSVQSNVINKNAKVIRFPEDGVNNNYESGQMTCWNIIGLSVPNINLFHDLKLAEPKFFDIESGYDKDLRYAIDSLNVKPPATKKHGDYCNGYVVGASGNEVIPYDHPAMKLMPDWGGDIMIDQSFAEKVKSKVCGSVNKFFRKRRFGQRNKYSGKFVDRDPDNKDSDDEDDDEGKYGDKDEYGIEDDITENSSFDPNEYMYGLERKVVAKSAAFERKAKKQRQYKWKLCKFAEILLSSEVLEKCQKLHWDLAAYKALSKLSSQLQGRIAHCLAIVFNLNPPDGFARFSDWSLGVTEDIYEDGFLEGKLKQNAIVETVLNVGETISKVNNQVSELSNFLKTLARGKGGYNSNSNTVFNDRIVHYMAECYVCSRDRCVLTDCELSGPGRIAYRAICRALRLQCSTFVLPSIFVGPKAICLRYLELQKNELDCGDVILLTEAIANQQSLILLDISYNRIGSRGITALCKVLRVHKSITTFRADHNRIGPVIGLDLGLFLKTTKSLKVLSLAYNRLGPMIRYSSPYTREKIPGALRDIFTGLKSNKGLQQLDLSYNHFGPEHVEYISVALNKHLTLNYLDLSGNDIGPDKGPSLIFSLAGQPGGDHMIKRREALLAHMKEVEKKAEEEGAPIVGIKVVNPVIVKKKVVKKKVKPVKSIMDADALEGGGEDDLTNKPAVLAYLGLAENQLGVLAAHGVAAMLKRNKSLTALDISGNAFGPTGGLIISEAFERVIIIIYFYICNFIKHIYCRC